MRSINFIADSVPIYHKQWHGTHAFRSSSAHSVPVLMSQFLRSQCSYINAPFSPIIRRYNHYFLKEYYFYQRYIRVFQIQAEQQKPLCCFQWPLAKEERFENLPSARCWEFISPSSDCCFLEAEIVISVLGTSLSVFRSQLEYQWPQVIIIISCQL